VERWGISPARNWVRLAHLPRVPRPWGPVPPGPTGQIGFVSHNRPCHRPPGGIVKAGRPWRWSSVPSKGIGFVCTSGPGGRAAPPNWLCFAHLSRVLRPCGLVPPSPREIGFVSYNRPVPAVRLAGNWVRFACSPLVSERPSHPTPPELGSFCALRPPEPQPTSQIGFVWRNRPARAGGAGLSPIRNRGIWFVWRICPASRVRSPQMPQSAQVWLCFAHFALGTPGRLPDLALFYTSHFTPQTSNFFQLALFGTISIGLEWWNDRTLE
jgi:hypothetical protein